MNPTEHHTLRSLSNLRLRKYASASVRSYADRLTLENHEPELEDLLKICSADPLLAVWILKQANGAYYGLRSTVVSLRKAFELLGNQSILHMISKTVGKDGEPSNEKSQKDSSGAVQSLVRHGLASAIYTARLSGDDINDGGPAFTAGLLHDIGKNLICLNFNEEAEGVYSESSLWDQILGTDLHSVEQLAFGFNHSEAGEYLARKMYFPDSLTVVLGHGFCPDPTRFSPDRYPLLWVTYAASLFSSATGYAAGKAVSMEYCLTNPVWQILVDEKLVRASTTAKMISDLSLLNGKVSEACSALPAPPPARLNADHDPIHHGQRNSYSTSFQPDPTSRNQSSSN